MKADTSERGDRRARPKEFSNDRVRMRDSDDYDPRHEKRESKCRFIALPDTQPPFSCVNKDFHDEEQ